MNPKRTKAKERRRARKLAEQAWEAVQEQQLDLAEKIIRRATATQPDNPVLWNDQGMILALRQKETEAEEAFYSALSLAPEYAEPYHHLAAFAARRGWLEKALGLAQRAAELAPNVATYRERLDAYRSLAGQGGERMVIAPVEEQNSREAPNQSRADPSSVPDFLQDLADRLAGLDWHQLGQRLTREGYSLIGQLIDAAICASLRRLFDHDELFAKTVVMNQVTFGQGVYRYFQAPVPDVVEGIRRTLYPHVARIANEWQRLLGDARRYPDLWDDFRHECHDAGQTTPTPILLKYEPGGFNALHRDLRGEVYFPVQLAVVLSPRADEAGSEGFQGGEFLFCDVPERTKSQCRAVAAGLGDALLFSTRDRLVRVGGTYGLQPVKHGVTPITAGTRFVLGLPFHEYR